MLRFFPSKDSWNNFLLNDWQVQNFQLTACGKAFEQRKIVLGTSLDWKYYNIFFIVYDLPLLRCSLQNQVSNISVRWITLAIHSKLVPPARLTTKLTSFSARHSWSHCWNMVTYSCYAARQTQYHHPNFSCSLHNESVCNWNAVKVEGKRNGEECGEIVMSSHPRRTLNSNRAVSELDSSSNVDREFLSPGARFELEKRTCTFGWRELSKKRLLVGMKVSKRFSEEGVTNQSSIGDCPKNSWV